MELFEFFDQKKVVSFYCDQSRPKTHLTGFIGAYSDGEIIIKHISPEGRYDGFVLIHRDDVFRVDTNGKYEQRIQKLYELKQQSHPDYQFTGHLYDSLLAFCKEQHFVISVELEDDELSGFLTDYDAEYVHLKLVNKYGELDGETILSISQIISFSVDSQKEQDLKMLSTEVGRPYRE